MQSLVPAGIETWTYQIYSHGVRQLSPFYTASGKLLSWTPGYGNDSVSSLCDGRGGYVTASARVRG